MTGSIVVCHESEYGNTQRVAETIAEELRRLDGMDVAVDALKGFDLDALAGYEMRLLGGRTPFGGLARRSPVNDRDKGGVVLAETVLVGYFRGSRGIRTQERERAGQKGGMDGTDWETSLRRAINP